jgi:hypothetical protein
MQTSVGFGRALAKIVIVAVHLLCALGTVSAGQRVYPAAAWSERYVEKETGWSRDQLQAADKVASSLGTAAYLVVYRGALVHQYGDITRPMNVYSARTSVLSILYGICVDRQVIDLHQTLADLGIDDKGGLSAVEKSATVQHLLRKRLAAAP